MRNQVFISYSHRDKKWLEKLLTMLKPLARNKKISVWVDTNIIAGSRWREEVEGALATAKVAVLLVSPHFLASDFIAEHELPPFLDAAKKEGVVILWIYLSSCLYDESEIKDYQAAHDIAKPLDSLTAPEQNAVLVDVCRKIKFAANPIGASQEDVPDAAGPQYALAGTSISARSGVPEPDNPRKTPHIETYLYISDTKVKMLLSQISKKMISDLCNELMIDSNILEELSVEPLTPRLKFGGIKIVERYLESSERIGSVDDPGAYFKGKLSMMWGTYDAREDPSPLVYFGGESPDTIVGLGGSSHHVIGSTGTSHPYSCSGTPFLVARLYKDLRLSDGKGDWNDRDLPAGEQYIAFAIDVATSQMNGISEPVKFLARKLAFFPKNTHMARRSNMNILLGTPLYVCSDSE